MKKNFGKILTGILTAGLAIASFTGCANTASGGNTVNGTEANATKVYRTLDEIKESGKINIGVFSDKNTLTFTYLSSWEYNNLFLGSTLVEIIAKKL